MVYDILPTTNLKYDDIRDTLNAGGGSVNNNVASAFKSAANINKWSKHKPVKLAVNFCQDFDSSAPNYDADWWKAKYSTCGLSIPFQPLTENQLNTLAYSAYNGSLDNYTYLLPTGTASEPFRLGDFARYNRNATEPFKTGITGYEAYSKNNIYPIEVNMFSTGYLNFFTSRTDNNEISLYDLIGMYSDYYLVVEACDSTSRPWYDNILYKYRSASPITTNDPSTQLQIQLDDGYLDKTIMFVTGIQRYNGSEYVGGSGFLAPWKDDGSNYPFLCYLKFVNYFDRTLVGLQFSVDMISKEMHDLPNSNVVYTSSDTIYVKFKMNKNSRRVIVVPSGSTYKPSGVPRMEIFCQTIGAYGFTVIGKPVNDNFQEITYADIPSGNDSEYVEFILKFEGLLKYTGLITDCLVSATVDDEATWVQASWLDINVNRT